ncbi:MAG: SpaA isopeptide-forming pilin-related protein [Clostridia bacterium]|nr:SpaA isopeptide-forming pilin-related protein [Clostridia bacterium]
MKIEWKTNTETIIENELKKGQINIIKVDEEDNEVKLQGVEFEVLDEKGNILEKIITDEKGKALTKKYPIRDFEKLTLREVKTLEEYVLNDNPITIKLTADKVTDVTIKNKKIKGKVEITKVDKKDNSKFLEGAKFGLYDENNNLIETLITDKTREGH